MTGPREIRLPAPRRRRWVLRTVILVAVLIVLLPAVATRIAEWLWYRDIGFERVFLTKIVAQWVLGLGAGAIGFVALYVNSRIALRGVRRKNLHIRDAREFLREEGADWAERLAMWLALPVALLFALFVAFASASSWRDLAQFFYRSPFGSTDPVFGRDVMYYVFTIPMVDLALGFLNALGWSVLLFTTLPMYFARRDIGIVADQVQQRIRFFVTPRAQTHVAVLGAFLLLVRALGLLFVDAPSLLLARHAVLFGATYTDLHVALPMIRVMAVVLVAAAVTLVWYARRGQFLRGASYGLGGAVAAGILLLGIVPGAYQRLVVQPNELAREKAQIQHYISASRTAWHLDSVETMELNGERPLTAADVAANQATVRNVRLWDRDPLLQTYGQIQSIRTYYDFVSVDDDRYLVNGELRQVLLSPRELNTAALPTRTFINEHLTYTHGMGVTMGPSNQVTPEGLPVLWIKDLPPASSIPIRITRPEIYFGEQSNDFILAPTRQREFDYPAGEGDAAVYSRYEGGSGVPVGSFWRRMLFAFRFGAVNILLSDDITPDSRILFHRDILERAQLALPFLDFDPDPFIVVTNEGRLVWMLDAYTVTDRYPYSQPIANDVNYMRNSVKVTIDAYTGATRAYLADPGDPMIRTLGRIYPGLLRPMSEMPADLRAHVRYPGVLFAAQSALYGTFHMTNPETFYHREDQWQVPGGGNNADAFMRHIVMRLPGEKDPEYVLMRPFTPRQKDNLAAWIVARNDGEHYGRLRVYSFPRQSLVFGPAQIVNRMNQDTEVSRQITLWDQRGSEVIRGELLVLPIEESLIYVQPLFLRAQGGQIPELKRVVVAHESQVAMEETLEAALARLFGNAPPPGARGSQPVAAPPTMRPSDVNAPNAANAANAALAKDALDTYERARAAQRAEDWATYGAEMKRLGDILRRLRPQQ